MKLMKKMFFTLAFFAMGLNMSYGATHFTETLPPAAPVSSVPVSNGYDWQLNTLPTCNTGGVLSWNPSSLSYVCLNDDFLLYSATTTVGIQVTGLSTMTVSAIAPTIPAAWWGVGKTVRLNLKGNYQTGTNATNWTFGVAIGTVTVAANAASSTVLNQTLSNFSEQALLTVASVGGAGTMLGEVDVYASSATAIPTVVLIASAPVTAATGINMLNAQTVFPNFTWGTADATMTVTNATIELMN